MLVLLIFFLSCSRMSDIERAEQIIDEQEIAQDILVLSSDSLLGRAPFTIGEERSLKYLTQRMKDIDLEPAFNSSYLQEVPLVELNSSIPEELVIQSKQKKLWLKAVFDFTAWSPALSEIIVLKNSVLLLLGYGISDPELE